MYMIPIVFIVLLIFVGGVYWNLIKKATHTKVTKPYGSKYDVNDFDENGFDRNGYNIDGRNANGKYNRLYNRRAYIDNMYSEEGFLNPYVYPIIITNHARERIYERIPECRNISQNKLVRDAYAYGKSASQLMKTSAMELRDIENRHENGVALVYRGYIYVFSEDNKLKTVFKNNSIII